MRSEAELLDVLKRFSGRKLEVVQQGQKKHDDRGEHDSERGVFSLIDIGLWRCAYHADGKEHHVPYEQPREVPFRFEDGSGEHNCADHGE